VSSKQVQRYDVGGLSKPVVTPAGFLRAEGYPTKAGIFVYRNPDGTTRRELRPPEEVFKADSLSTLQLAPVTDDHPPGNLTAENASEYQRGAVGETVRQDGDLVAATLMVTDKQLRDKMMKGKQALSCGYVCDVDEVGGEWNGQRYDAVQRNIRYNHLAVVERGRAGADARVRMDAADAGMVSDPQPGAETPTTEEHKTMSGKTFRHDGVTYEGSEQVVELFAKLERQRADAVKDREDAIKESKAQISTMQGKLDAAEEKVKQLKADAEKLPEQVRKEIAARMQLEAAAKKHLGKAHKLDGLTDREVRAAVLKKLAPKLDVAGKDDAYVAARFDAAIEDSSADGSEEIRRVRKDAEGKSEGGEGGEDHFDEADPEAAHERMKAANREEWKKPIGRIAN
jgi:hypothetical protein